MRYSVVIPAFNAAETIEECIRSVLDQTVPPEEIVVVDDGSTDETAELALRPSGPIRIIRQVNGGAGSATTTGIGGAKSPIVAGLDADDLWLPHKMEIQLGHLRARPAAHGVFAHWRTFGNSTSGGKVSPGWSRTTMVIRTDSALELGPIIDPPGGRGDMVDWLARAREAGLALDMLEEVLALRRIRPGSLSHGRDPDRDRGYARVAWLALQRKKQPPAAE